MKFKDFSKLNLQEQHDIKGKLCLHIGLLTESIDLDIKTKQEIKEKYHHLVNINYIRNINQDKDIYKKIMLSQKLSYIAIKTAYNIPDI